MPTLKTRVARLGPLYHTRFPRGASVTQTIIWLTEHGEGLATADYDEAAAMLMGLSAAEYARKKYAEASAAAYTKQEEEVPADTRFSFVWEALKLCGILLLVVAVVVWGVGLIYRIVS